MSYAIARVGDKVRGTCSGNYDSWEVVGHTSKGKSIYGWITRHETGIFTGEIISGSTILFDGEKAIARMGDKVKINKEYSHSNHHDDINVETTITQGSTILIDGEKAIAYVGCKITGNGFEGTIVTGSNVLFTSY